MSGIFHPTPGLSSRVYPILGSPVPGLHRASASSPAPSITLSAASMADSAAENTVIGTVSAPAGYTLVLNDDQGGLVKLVGNELQRGALANPFPRSERITLGAFVANQAPDPAQPALGLTADITVTPARAPSDISGLIAAWRADAGVTMNVDGVQVDSVAGAWGTSVTATGAVRLSAPTPFKPRLIANGGPGGKPVFRFGGATSRSRFDFTATAGLTAFTAIVLVEHTVVAGAQGYWAHQTDGTLLSTVSNVTAGEEWVKQVTFKGGAAAAQNVSLTNVVDRRGFQFVAYSYDGTTRRMYINGVLQSGTAAQAATTHIFNTFGGVGTAAQAGGSHLDADVSAMLLYNRALDATEIERLYAMLQPWITTDIFFSLAGSDANHGFTPAAPRLTPNTFINSYRNAPGLRYHFRGGDRFDVAGPLSPQTGGSAGRRTALRSYGSGRATLATSTRFTSGWTDLGGQRWSRVMAAEPNGVWLIEGNGTVRVLVPRTASQDWSYEWTAGTTTLTIQLPTGYDANTSAMELGRNIRLLDTDRNHLEFEDVICIGGGNHAPAATGSGEILRPRGTTATVFRNVSMPYGNGDGFSMGSGLVLDCDVGLWGDGLETASSGGRRNDAITGHGGTFDVWRLTVQQAFEHATAHQSHTTARHYDCTLTGAIVSDIPVVGADNGTVIYERCTITRTAGGVDDGIIKGPLSNATLLITDVRLIGQGTVRGKAVNTNAAPGTTTLTRVTQTGFASLT